MLNKIKNKIEKELGNFIREQGKAYSLNRISPLLSNNIKDFVLRKGKRVRPALFVIGYLGFAGKAPAGLYKTALSIELLHDFMLVHDDIIDKSDTRRGKPSMHKMLNNYLRRFKNAKFKGEDLAIVAGDVIYAMAINAFLSIKVDMERKEKGLRKLIEATIYTAMGEFIEVLSGAKDIDKITGQDINRIYDYKTAYYSFAAPLSCGAILAGASDGQADRLYRYGIYLGRAFQIKDDIMGIFGDEKKIGKSILTDLQEGKKTLLLWYAYKNSARADKLLIKRTLSKNRINRADLFKIRKIIVKSGALSCAGDEVSRLLRNAQGLIKSSSMRKKYKDLLNSYTKELLSL